MTDLRHLLENTFDRKRISTKPNPNPKAHQCFRPDEMTHFSSKCTYTRNDHYNLPDFSELHRVLWCFFQANI